ncbi:MAG: prepilin-type N-terminal cleavage/methylation domain-containing protein [Syntrophales bacterium]|nr:prepilin-type N-terminal cleavage/methylation domain-containing protein [Syntrophales bacterium]
MCSMRSNSRGTSLVEVVIAMFIISVGILALLSIQPEAWKMAGRTDFLGRAAGILQNELERTELAIMNPNNAVVVGTNSRTVNASGEASAQPGDMAYTVTTTVAAVGTDSWRVTVGINWTGHAQGISGSVLVTRQEHFRS